MKHLGDITQLHGYDAAPVDCITFGSPCQDLSQAGKRAGLAGERSGLFMDAVRIIKEMRGATNGRYPTFAVWENVAGAFSSNNGDDFRAVLEELASVRKEGIAIPRPSKKWSKAGFICGDDWSIAWRLLDSQYWGVPQRRKRIALVADFAGQRAGEILFERACLSGDSETRRKSWQEIAGYPAYGTGKCSECGYTPKLLKIRVGCEGGGKGALIQDDLSATLALNQDQTLFQPKPYGICSYASNSMKSSNPHSGIYEADTSRTLDLNGGSPACNQGGVAIVAIEGNGSRASHKGDVYKESDTMYTLNTIEQHGVSYAADFRNMAINDDITSTLQSNPGGGFSLNYQPGVITYQDKAGTLTPGQHCGSYNGQDAYNDMLIAYNNHSGDSRITEVSDECVHTLSSRMGTGGNNIHLVADTVRWIVRRLTPTECERLQGFPDGWTDIGDWTDTKGKMHKASDTPRYKALGNSIALPQWHWLTQQMSAYLPEHATLGSLFDGIGGFPFVWEMVHGKGTAVWASEIEEFPIAVTKIRFPDIGE